MLAPALISTRASREPARRLPTRLGEPLHPSARGMSLGLELILSTTLVAGPPACSWAHPGANPYRGDPMTALADFDLPEATRGKLREMMRAHRPTDIAAITRDDIVGDAGAYADLREMHSGHGHVCHGNVDRSAWSASRRERALVYCAGDACVIVPTICNNVSLVTRKPDRDAMLDETPIDIEPAAGPKPELHDATLPPAPPLDFLPPAAVPGGGDGTPAAPPGDGGGGGEPGGGGNPPCCDTLPIGPGSPGVPPVTPASPVPETPAALLLLAALAALWPRRRR